MRANKKVLPAFLLPFVSFAIALTVADPTYHVSDDVTMRSIIEGSYNPDAGSSEYVVFLNVLYGKLLRFLYQLIQSIGWYDVFATVFLLISWAAVTHVVLSAVENKYKKILFASILFLFSFVTFLNVQYTMIAGICAASGMLSVVYLGFINQKRNLYLTFWIPTGLIISSLLRFNMMYAVLILTVILIYSNAKIFHFSTLDNKQLKHVLLALLVGITISGTLKFYHNYHYNNRPETREVLPYIGAFQQLYDYASPVIIKKGIHAETENKLKNTGWTAINYYMLISAWFSTGEGIFDAKHLQNTYNAIGQDIQSDKKHPFNIVETFLQQLIASGALLIVSLLFLLTPNKRFITPLICCLVCYTIYVTLITTFFKAPPGRVSFPLLVFLMFFLVLIGAQLGLYKESNNCTNEDCVLSLNPKVLQWTQGIISSIIFLIVIIYTTISVKQQNAYSSMVRNYPFNPSNIYFYEMDAGVLQPYKRATVDLSNKITFTWHQMLPIHHDKMKRLGLYPDFWQKVCSKDNFRFLVGGQNNDLGRYIYSFEILNEFLKKEYNLDAKPVVTNEYGGLTEYAIICTTL